VPDVNTLWDFREALIRAKALDKLFARLNAAITTAGYLPMGGQIIDASLIAAPKQRNTDEEKAAIKAGKSADEIWPDEPNKAAQKDTNARWTVKQGKAPAPGPDGKTPPALGACPIRGKKIIRISIPVFGYKDHIGINRRFGFIRTQKTTDAAAHDGARLREGLIDPENTASDVWADTAYRSLMNEDYLEGLNRKSRIHRKKPAGKPMSQATAKANAKKSTVRCHVEHVFAELKSRMIPKGLCEARVVRTIGIARAEATITLANMAFNMKRWVFLNVRTLPA
jgi:transposase, IS5 family